MAKRFGIAWKLLTVCAAFALPIVVMFVLMTQAKLAEIEFTSKELQGDAFQRPLEDVLRHVSAHERFSARLSRGQAEPGLEARIRAEVHEVTAALKRGSIEIDSEIGLGTTIRCGFPQEMMGGRLAITRDRRLTRSLAPP